MTPDDDRTRPLRRAKLVALARGIGAQLDDPTELGSVTAGAAGSTAFALAASSGPGSLAAALLYAHRSEAARLVLFVDDADHTLARLGSYFEPGGGAVEVRHVEGTGSEPLAPAPLESPQPAPPVPDELLDPLLERGLEVVVEHGSVTAEVLGLEVARLVRWPAESGGDDELHLEPGVGRFDRDAVAAAHADSAPEQALDRAVELVRTHRRAGGPSHPLQLLARERWLRAELVAEPARVGAAELVPAEMTTVRSGLKDAHPAAALGTDADGHPVVVVCSCGVDPALVPLAADTRQLHDPEARLVLALAGRDHHPATARLAAMLRRPAQLRSVPTGWV